MSAVAAPMSEDALTVAQRLQCCGVGGEGFALLGGEEPAVAQRGGGAASRGRGGRSTARTRGRKVRAPEEEQEQQEEGEEEGGDGDGPILQEVGAGWVVMLMMMDGGGGGVLVLVAASCSCCCCCSCCWGVVVVRLEQSRCVGWGAGGPGPNGRGVPGLITERLGPVVSSCASLLLLLACMKEGGACCSCLCVCVCVCVCVSVDVHSSSWTDVRGRTWWCVRVVSV